MPFAQLTVVVHIPVLTGNRHPKTLLKQNKSTDYLFAGFAARQFAEEDVAKCDESARRHYLALMLCEL
jgi:hypothetical protein